ncbi:MAG TPA: APC family permease [Solirubrobacteraceae bacterium]|jgi:amino acid transporter|nr:APC family permease [Solirubrobacteraceae bacterium]
MAGAVVPSPNLAPALPRAGAEVVDKGLRKGAIGFISSVVIGVASTAPGYSLAATLGLIVTAVGFQSPAVLWVAFIPMLCIASAYLYMNRTDPDCGTTFAWVSKAMGPWAGWLGGWAIVVSDVIVMANLAQIAGLYSFTLFGWDAAAASTVAVTAVGVLWIVVMTAITVIGIELSARTQWYLLGAEVVTLVLFAVVALVRVYTGHALAGATHPSLSWFSPFAIDGGTAALTAGVLLAVFIYWGWDSAVSANEETEDPTEAPGKSAIVSTIMLVGIYLLVATAAVAFAGTKPLDGQDDALSILGNDVLGGTFGKLIIVAVLTSAAASTQTTILPTARTVLSMARAGAMPEKLGVVHPRYMTPHIATILFGAVSIVWYVGMTIVSQNILYDSIAALGLMIAFYYGITGFACALYYRREGRRSLKGLLFAVIAPALGGVILTWVLVKSVIDLSKPANSESGDSWFGLGPPLVIGVGFMLLGAVLMVWWSRGHRRFFEQRIEVFEAAAE